MASFIELLVILITSFGFNLIPFAGPSNLFIASNLALIYGIENPAFLLSLGFLVALGATLAKSIHYLVTFFVSKHLREKQRQRLEEKSHKIKRWAFLLLFAAAASPIPDEPVVIPLGLLKYSPVKFFSAFFLGKLSITVAGAFLGSWTKRTLSEWLSPEVMVTLSIILTIAVTILILKVDIGKLAQKIPRKKSARSNYFSEKLLLRAHARGECGAILVCTQSVNRVVYETFCAQGVAYTLLRARYYGESW